MIELVEEYDNRKGRTRGDRGVVREDGVREVLRAKRGEVGVRR
jgi:hypothetical protein